MNILKRIHPDSHDGDKNTEHQFSTQEEFLNIYWIKSKMDNPNFHQLSLSSPSKKQIEYAKYTDMPVPRTGLMVEYDNGSKFFVIGYFNQLEDRMDLPEWKYPEYEQI